MRKPAGRILTYRAGGVGSAVSDAIAVAAEAREAERLRIARELHDSVVQPLASLVMSLTYLERRSPRVDVVDAYVDVWKNLAQEALDSLRTNLVGLSTHPHAGLGLREAISRYVAPQLERQGLAVLFEDHGWPADLPVEWTSHLYLVVREALTNVAKHAHASEVVVVLRADSTYLSIDIADDGVGFRSGRRANGARRGVGTGLGIISMHDRVRLLGGRLRMVSALGQGVRLNVRLRWPDCGGTTNSATGGGTGSAAVRKHTASRRVTAAASV